MSAADRSVTLDVHLLGRDYKVACRDDERADLLEAVAYLDRRMREIRGSSKTAGADRIIVMAALNIANELLRERKAPGGPGAVADGAGVQRRIQSMQAAIEQALDGQEKLF
jgi:cell division protein ZapA